QPRLEGLVAANEARRQFVNSINTAFQIGCRIAEARKNDQGRSDHEFYDAAHPAMPLAGQLLGYLLPDERVKYNLVRQRHDLLEEERQRTLPVLDWLVFPLDVAAKVKHTYFSEGSGDAGSTVKTYDPAPEIIGGAPPSKWKQYWKEVSSVGKTPYAMASLPDLLQAEEILYELLVERRGLYADSELEAARTMQQRIREAMHDIDSKTHKKLRCQGLLLDTTIKFRDNMSNADIHHHGGHEGHGYRDVLLELGTIETYSFRNLIKHRTIHFQGEQPNATQYTGRRLLEALWAKQTGYLDHMDSDGTAERVEEMMSKAGVDAALLLPLTLSFRNKTLTVVLRNCELSWIDAENIASSRGYLLQMDSQSSKIRYATLGVNKDAYDKAYGTEKQGAAGQ
ncbi:hypothetical protein HY501_02150, partial [Candidatus Woesearchaeota archaeon]|nr:hypothetical protein [Candidatus Woesearchaeota archaeon]